MIDLFAMFGSVNSFLTFSLAAVRIVSMLMTMPIFNYQTVRPNLRFIIAVGLAMLAFQYIEPINFEGVNAVIFIIVVLREVLIGLLIGSLAGVLEHAVTFGSYLISFAMSFAMSDVLDPSTNVSISVMGNFYRIGALMVFLLAGGLTLVIRIVTDIFKYVPVGYFPIEQNFFLYVVIMLGEIFVIAFRIYMPVFVAILLVNVINGIMGRLTPQINLLVAGLPLQIILGSLIVVASFPYFLTYYMDIIDTWLSGVLNSIATLQDKPVPSF